MGESMWAGAVCLIVVALAYLINRLDRHDDQPEEPQKAPGTVLLYRPCSFSQPAVKGFVKTTRSHHGGDRPAA